MSLESTILVTGIEKIGQAKGKRAQSEIKLTDILKACNNKLTATHQSLEGVLQGDKLKEFPPINEYIEEKSTADKVQNAIVTGEISQRSERHRTKSRSNSKSQGQYTVLAHRRSERPYKLGG